MDATYWLAFFAGAFCGVIFVPVAKFLADKLKS